MTGPGDDRDGPARRAETVAREYYRAIDAADYERLASLLAPGFVHDRPDLTLEGRDRFVAFMREERPQTDTTHPIDAVYRPDDDGDSPAEVVVRGRLLGDGGERIVGFVDVHRIDDGTIRRLTTYAR